VSDLLDKLKAEPLSYSRLSTFMKCPRDFQLHYIEGVRTRKTPTYFTLGGAVHAALESWRLGHKDYFEEIGKAFDKVATAKLTAAELNSLEVDRARAEGMVNAYVARYSTDRMTYKMKAEQKFILPLCNGWKILGFIDALYLDRHKNLFVVENKTTSRVDSDYFTQAKMDHQILLYHIAAKHITGKEPKGVIYDVLLKPGIRLKIKESKKAFQQRVYETIVKDPSKFLVREEIWLEKKRIKEAWKTIKFYAMLLENYIKKFGTDPWPKCTTSCIGKYGSCRFMPICSTDRIDPFTYTTK